MEGCDDYLGEMNFPESTGQLFFPFNQARSTDCNSNPHTPTRSRLVLQQTVGQIVEFDDQSLYLRLVQQVEMIAERGTDEIA